jgi:anaerobic selenocysteine-containing dehydrogenase
MDVANQNKRVIKSICQSCHGGCSVSVKVENGKITGVKGNPDSLTKGTMCVKGPASIEDVYDSDRILYPLKRKGKRGGCEWKRISWDEALDTIAQ